MNANDPPGISIEWARERVERLRGVMRAGEVDVVVLHEWTAVKHIAGASSMHGWPSALVVSPSRVVAGFFATKEQEAAVDEQVVVPGIRRDRPVDHARELADAIRTHLRVALDESRGSGSTIGLAKAFTPLWLSELLADLGWNGRIFDLESDLARLRRRKDPDELAIIRHNVAISEAAYHAARDIIAPGRTELDVFQAMRNATERVAGSSVPLGGDFAAGPGGGIRGGEPSRRILQEGDSFVIDFWPSDGGYWADMCRTYAVGRPSPALREAVDLTIEALELAEPMIVPGGKAADVDQAIREFLAEHEGLGGGDYFNLTGHGLGLASHEAPWILTDSDDFFELGDVVAVEPALYGETLNGGARTEDNYVVLADGVKNLCSLPRRLM